MLYNINIGKQKGVTNMKIENIAVANEYSIISSFDLVEGMAIPYELYYKNNSEYNIALRNSSLSKLSLIQLQKLEMTYGNLYVKTNNYRNLQNIIKVFTENKKYTEFLDSLNGIRSKVNIIIDNAFKSKTIDKDESEVVCFKIKNTIISFNASQIIQAITNVRDDKKYLYNHSIHVAFLNGLMGKWLNLDDEHMQQIVKVGFLHDIGKAKIPQEILDKPSSLTSEEFKLIKLHPIHSFNMLINSGERDKDVLIAVRGHHEKTNGTGYPDGLTYDRLSLYARITTISDIYDAMVSKRVYKDAQSPFEVLDEFSRGRFSNLDTHLINIFLQNMPSELLGRKVVLSDGRIGIVAYVNHNNYAFPLINVDEEIIQTNENLRCLCVCD